MDDYAARLLADHPDIDEIVVFGSFERGTWAPGSDLDVFIVLASSARTVRDRIVDFLPGAFPVGLDLFPFTRAEIAARAGSPLLDAVHHSRWRYDRRSHDAVAATGGVGEGGRADAPRPFPEPEGARRGRLGRFAPR